MSSPATTKPLTQNEALENMGRFLDLATKRGAFNLVEVEELLKSLAVFRVPVDAQTSGAPAQGKPSEPSITTI
jgi:hypothetical protein